MQTDGSIYYDTRITTENFDKDAKSLQKKLKSVMKGMEKLSVGIDNAAKATPAGIASAEKKLVDLQYAIEEFEDGLRRLGEKEIFSKDFLSLDKQKDKLQKQLDTLYSQIAAREAQLGNDNGKGSSWLYEQDKQWLKLREKIEAAEQSMLAVQKKMDQFEAVHGSDVEAYRQLSAGLEKAREEYELLNGQVKEFSSGSEGALDGVTKSVSRFGSMFKLIVGRMIVRELINQIGQGFQNLAKYSGTFNKSMSSMKSSLSALRNSLATAFAPIVEVAIPYLVKLVDFVTMAINAVAKFIAALSGKTTYVKATKAAENYAEAAGAAADAAERGARAFDELNEIDTGSSSGGGAGGASVGDMFEEVSIDAKILANLDTIKRVVEDIGIVVAAWGIGKIFKKDLTSVAGWMLTIKGSLNLIADVMQAFSEGVDFENVISMIISVAELTAGLSLAFGKSAGALGLLTGGLVMFASGIKDIITGNYSPAALSAAILGIGAAGAALAVLIGGWGPLLGAAVAAAFTVLLTGISEKWDELKAIWGNNELDFFEKIVASCLVLGEFVGSFLEDMFNGILGFFGLTWEGIKDIFSPVAEWFENVFGTAWEAVKNVFSAGGEIFEGIKEGISASFRNIVNKLIDGINNVMAKPFNKINSALSTIRNIEILGSKPFRGIGSISVPKIPHLATGAVIPPNKEFLAVLGDQNKGTNIETPEALLRKIMREELGEENEDGRPIYVNVRIGNSTMKKVLIGTLKDIRKTSGVEVVLG